VLAKVFPGLVMLSYAEIVGDMEIKTFGTVPNRRRGKRGDGSWWQRQ